MAIHTIKNYVSNFTPTITFGTEHAKLELTPNKKTTAANNVEEILMLMERLLKHKKIYAAKENYKINREPWWKKLNVR